ncbi:LuxR C-terminal-related transcriptional regulator [Virgibacillus halodenitrificans]|uniref:LuxR C-terminal-related transcriptional regulator n=1 Tax=Virgibacillus halodenitrificans TaxID=1482 RepID=UPI001FB3DE9D|nr:LuxR C-terminal-related transcriptional regulator [Virgibacillus halodenitrificans]MCJ0932938.1 LuxR C-terminal-related transcriptional regulator [Virgibacillus halodenitrificans]
MDKQQIENTLRDYAWMINEIKRQRGMLEDIGENVVAQSGIESTMPKAQGNTSDPVAMEVIRRDKKSKWVEKLEKKVLFIQQRIPVITEEREKAVLECMLDGMSMIAISQHMGLSRRHIYTIKNDIVDKIAQISHFAHNAHFAQQMTNEKRCV